MTCKCRLIEVAALLISMMLVCGVVVAQTRGQGPWWPHPIWGSQDQAGAANWMTPDKIRASLSLIKTGKIYELGFPYEDGMPLPKGRSYKWKIPKTMGPYRDTGLIWHEETLCTQIGQVGTQFDGLGHIGQRITMQNGKHADVFYNGFTANEIYAPEGLKALGVENAKPILTRGVLIDIAALKGVDTLPDGYAITMDDVRQALAKENIAESSIAPGDALLFNTGWWRTIGDKKKYISYSWPGIDGDVARWVIDKKASLIGSDTDGDLPGQWNVHFDILMKNGIFNLEFMTFESVLKDNIHEFLFVFTPIRFKGGTGSPGRPLAIL